ncbi:MAG: zinc-ribbon domain-containing protein [Clostridiales bacterium]|nr:zinc-ribbon domain-containing protein [Clostridia bacterium]MCR4564250.1 zinc-ribbon domain-containing protein [Clostridiales bacterium]
MKYCSKCGSIVEGGAEFCSECGAPVNEPVHQAQQTYQQPVYQPPVYQQPYYDPQAQMNKEIDTANTLGIVSLVCSLLGAGFFAIAAIVTGIICMNKIKPFMNDKIFPSDKARTSYNLGKAGMIIAIVKLCLGLVFAVFWIVFVAVGAGTAILNEVF